MAWSAFKFGKVANAMVTIDSTEVYTAGDIHGHPQDLVRDMRRLELHGAAIIVLGDCGLGMGLERWLPNLQQELESCDNVMYLLRGNHDKPDCFAAGADTGYDRIRLLPDFERVCIAGEEGVVMGGALSLDRGRRRPGVDYWAGEVLNLAAAQKALKGQPPVSFVLAHTSPEPPCADASAIARCAMVYHDAALLRDADAEQETVSCLLSQLCPKRWYAGHWHLHADFRVGDTQVLVHDCNELRPWR